MVNELSDKITTSSACGLFGQGLFISLSVIVAQDHQKNSHSVPRSVIFVLELVILPPICNERMY
jgi:hypothetical protein